MTQNTRLVGPVFALVGLVALGGCAGWWFYPKATFFAIGPGSTELRCASKVCGYVYTTSTTEHACLVTTAGNTLVAYPKILPHFSMGGPNSVVVRESSKTIKSLVDCEYWLHSDGAEGTWVSASLAAKDTTGTGHAGAFWNTKANKVAVDYWLKDKDKGLVQQVHVESCRRPSVALPPAPSVDGKFKQDSATTAFNASAASNCWWFRKSHTLLTFATIPAKPATKRTTGSPVSNASMTITSFKYGEGSTEFQCGKKPCGFTVVEGPDEYGCVVTRSTDTKWAKMVSVHPGKALPPTYAAVAGPVRKLTEVKSDCEDLGNKDDVDTAYYEVEDADAKLFKNDDKGYQGALTTTEATVVRYWYREVPGTGTRLVHTCDKTKKQRAPQTPSVISQLTTTSKHSAFNPTNCDHTYQKVTYTEYTGSP